MSMRDDLEWLIWSSEHQGWWRGNGVGYTPKLAEAGRFQTLAAVLICSTANRYELPHNREAPPQESMVLAPEGPHPDLASVLAEGASEGVIQRAKMRRRELP
jgi:hypothetical protein